MLRILIADDEPITRMDLSMMLGELSYHVVGEACDGFDAVELCRRHRPDVVLMDVNMPVFDGLTASEKIICEHLAGCVILLTAFNDAEIIERAKQIGVSGYLVKPIEQRLLRPTIEVSLAQSVRFEESRAEIRQAKQQLSEAKQIARAQAILAEREGIAESEAYRMLRSMSMQKRTSIASLAQAIIEQEQSRRDFSYTQALLVKKKHLSPSAAAAQINKKAASLKCSRQEAAKLIRDELEAEHD